MAEPQIKRPKKLIACCDGTWMDADTGYVKGSWFSGPGHLQTPSNVTRISRAILAEDSNEHPQIVYYQAGVGGGSSTVERLVGGGTGAGLGEHVREAYSFLANNYTDGDSIFLLGFSRGAFTARSIGGLIGGMGLLEKAGLPWFYLIFKDWENAGVEDYEPVIQKEVPDFKITCPPKDIEGYLDSYRKELVRRKWTQEVDIQAIGVWDTVGALGIPTPSWLQALGLPDFLHEYKFLDTSIDNHIKYAFHAMALDEQRASYSPTIWERPEGCNTILKQVWFPGVHSNVGGSYDDTGIADITLAWMMSNLSPWIDFNPNYIHEQHALNQKHNAKHRLLRGWSLGKLYDSCTFPTSLGGKQARTPDQYHRFNYFTNKVEPNIPLRNTNEMVHASVRTRLRLHGKGYEDRGRYDPPALRNWHLEGGEGYSDSVGNGGPAKDEVKWVYRGDDPQANGKVLFEDRLGKFELELLDKDPVAVAEVLSA